MAVKKENRVTRPQDSILKSALRSSLKSAVCILVVPSFLGLTVALRSGDPGPKGHHVTHIKPGDVKKRVAHKAGGSCSDPNMSDVNFLTNCLAPTDKASQEKLAELVAASIRLDYVRQIVRQQPQNKL